MLSMEARLSRVCLDQNSSRQNHWTDDENYLAQDTMRLIQFRLEITVQ